MSKLEKVPRSAFKWCPRIGCNGRLKFHRSNKTMPWTCQVCSVSFTRRGLVKRYKKELVK